MVDQVIKNEVVWTNPAPRPDPNRAISALSLNISRHHTQGGSQYREAIMRDTDVFFAARLQINEGLQDRVTFFRTLSNLNDLIGEINMAHRKGVVLEYQSLALERALQILSDNINVLEQNLTIANAHGDNSSLESIFTAVASISALHSDQVVRFMAKYRDILWKVLQSKNNSQFIHKMAGFINHSLFARSKEGTSLEQFSKDLVSDAMGDGVKHKPLSEIVEALFEYRYDRAGEMLTSIILGKSGLSNDQIKDVISAWRKSAPIYTGKRPIDKNNIVSLPAVVKKNLETIMDLEGRKSGVTKFLLEKFGIRCFGRYPTKLLLRQFDTFGDQGQFGIILSSIADYSGGYYVDVDLYDKLFDDIGEDYIIRVTETDDKYLRSQYEKIRALYSPPIAFEIVNVHGSIKDMQFSEGPEGMLTIEDIESGLLDGLSEIFDPDAVHVLGSCSAALGIAGKYSEKVKGKTIAPTTDTAIKSITVIKNGKKIDFDITFRDGEAWIFYNGKRIN